MNKKVVSLNIQYATPNFIAGAIIPHNKRTSSIEKVLRSIQKIAPTGFEPVSSP